MIFGTATSSALAKADADNVAEGSGLLLHGLIAADADVSGPRVTIGHMHLTRSDVLRVVDALVSGEMTREEVSRWAATPLLGEPPDPIIEEVLDLLVIIDGWQMDQEGQKTGYLYDFSDIIAIRPALLPNA